MADNTLRRSLWIDGKPHRAPVAITSDLIKAPSWVMGRVTDIMDNGWLEVEVPADNPETHATGPTDGLITQVGALVRVLLDSSGRILQIASPQTIDESQPVTPMGAAGAMVQKARSDAQRAFSEAAEVRGRADAAKAAADAAAQSATAALQAAEKNAGSVFLATEPPNPKEGMIWYQTNATGQIIGVKVRVGSAWVARPIVAEQVLVPGSVGNVSLAEGSVRAENVYASKEMWAKVAAFGAVTTEMLTAGNATITGNAVVGDLYGNSLNGVIVRGSEFTLQDAEANNAQTRSARLQTEHWRLVGAQYMHFASNSIQVSHRENSTRWGVEYVIPQDGAPAAGAGGNIRIVADCVIPPGMTVNVIPIYRINGSDGNVLLPGGTTTTASIPDGAELQRVQIMASGAVGSFIVRSLTISWTPTVLSGLSIKRDGSAGVAQIEMRTVEGAARLRPDSVAYIDRGQVLGSVRWRDLIAPPIAIAGWDSGAGSNAASGQDGILSASAARSKTLLGGFYIHQGYLKTPTAGWYQVNASCGFRWESSQPSWAVAVGIRRSSRSAVDWFNDPASTLSLIPSQGTRPSASDLIHLGANEGVTLAFWQNTGAWRPNYGPSRLSLHLIDAD